MSPQSKRLRASPTAAAVSINIAPQSAVLLLVLLLCTFACVVSSAWCPPGGTSCYDGECNARSNPDLCLDLGEFGSFSICQSFCWYDRERCVGCNRKDCAIGCPYNCNSTVITMPDGFQSTCSACTEEYAGVRRGCDARVTCSKEHGVVDRSDYSFGHCESCKAGWWGLDCQHECLCKDPATCDWSTGGCSCPAGSHQMAIPQPAGSGQAFLLQCVPCGAGHYMASPSAPTTSSYDCLACPPGSWSSEHNATACDLPCPEGYVCAGGVMTSIPDNTDAQIRLVSLLVSLASLLVACLKFLWDIYTIRRKYPGARISCRMFWRESLPWGDRCIALPEDVMQMQQAMAQAMAPMGANQLQQAQMPLL